MSNLPMRLAFREEGEHWVAYCAAPETMEGALEIGRIKMGIVVNHRELRDDFMALMKRVIELAVADAAAGAQIESWGEEQRAPESERSGSA